MGFFDKVRQVLRGSARDRPSATVTADSPAPRLRRHTVLPGQTFSAIAELHGVAWPEMADLNGVKEPELIYPGQVFKVPQV